MLKEFISSIKGHSLIDASTRGKAFCYFFFVLILQSPLVFAENNSISSRTRIYMKEVSKDSVLLKISNSFFVPVTVRLQLNLENLQSDSKEIVAVVPARTEEFTLSALHKTDSNKPYKCSYNWKIVTGDITKVPDAAFEYNFPFDLSKHYQISQGPDGEFSHHGVYAFDFVMPVGTPVLAARDGVVAMVKKDSQQGGADKSFIELANYVSIYHEDGTIANYYHLKTDGVLVKEGQMVKKGDVIGYSGNTGFSNGPHLHFEVIQPTIDTQKNKSIAFRWDEAENRLYSDNHKKSFLQTFVSRF